MRTIVFANWKGGVGKTTSTANIAAALSESGRVLMIDLDPQANLTEAFGFLDPPEVGIEHVLDASHPATLVDAAVPVGPQLDLVPTSDGLANFAWQLGREADYPERLREALEPVKSSYAYTLIDTPPGLGLWPGLALLSADAVVIPTRPHDADVNATGKLCDYIEDDIRPTNPDLDILGALLTQSDKRWNLFRATHRALEGMGIPTFQQVVPSSVTVAAAPRTGKPIVWVDPSGRPARAYRAAAAAISARFEQQVAA